MNARLFAYNIIEFIPSLWIFAFTNLNTWRLEGLAWAGSSWRTGSDGLYLFVWNTERDNEEAGRINIGCDCCCIETGGKETTRKEVAFCQVNIHENDAATLAVGVDWQVLYYRKKKKEVPKNASFNLKMNTRASKRKKKNQIKLKLNVRARKTSVTNYGGNAEVKHKSVQWLSEARQKARLSHICAKPQ